MSSWGQTGKVDGEATKNKRVWLGRKRGGEKTWKIKLSKEDREKNVGIGELWEKLKDKNPEKSNRKKGRGRKLYGKKPAKKLKNKMHR